MIPTDPTPDATKATKILAAYWLITAARPDLDLSHLLRSAGPLLGFRPEAVAATRAYLGSMDRLLTEGCLGQIPEIIDGDAPHLQRGCDAQAWGATKALRVWKLLGPRPN